MTLSFRNEADAIHSVEGRIVQIAARYVGPHCPFEELQQEGRIGALVAWRRFDPCRGASFLTYADHWINRYIRRYHEAHRSLIHLPSHVTERMAHLARARHLLRMQLRREPTTEEIAAELALMPQEVDALLRIGAPVASLDEPVSENATRRLGETIPAEGMLPDSQVGNMQTYHLLSKLPAREGAVMRLRVLEQYSLEEVSRQLGLSRERVRQIQNMAIRRLQSKMIDSI